ncbi:DNA adenine methylase [Mariprofundus ferrooxydans]|uniref:DNA adenine methylase n=1 Tax=Mariprofundus ferrooxydans TaxID=314344 RepID=UPI0006A72BBC|nr:DNA adenine methylase [Mariprofundus ferrooxydans]KON48570.1 DNA methyltransferase [Mariprofundus ferrooxydans]
MSSFSTPLRYPGGKGRLACYVSELLEANDLAGGTYAEPFCGGAGIALSLLYAEKVNSIHLNDADRSIYAFWYAAIHENENLCRLIHDTEINMDVWYQQRQVQQDKETADLLDLGFSTFFLNRTNRSGIIGAGVIGGKEQNGTWKMDARFKKGSLIERIELIGHYADSINVTHMDVLDFIDEICPTFPDRTLIYFDPPYFKKGQQLYRNHFVNEDHANLAQKIQTAVQQPWIVSYDNVPEISSLYSNWEQEPFMLSYSANLHGQGSELMVFKDGVEPPSRVYSSRKRVA